METRSLVLLEPSQAQVNLIPSEFDMDILYVVLLVTTLLFYKLIAPTIWKLVR